MNKKGLETKFFVEQLFLTFEEDVIDYIHIRDGLKNLLSSYYKNIKDISLVKNGALINYYNKSPEIIPFEDVYCDNLDEMRKELITKLKAEKAKIEKEIEIEKDKEITIYGSK